MYRHRRTIDFTKMAPKHRQALQPALEKTDYPLSRIKAATGKRVPVTVGDLSRFQQMLEGSHGHVHITEEYEGEAAVGHVLGVPPDVAEKLRVKQRRNVGENLVVEEIEPGKVRAHEGDEHAPRYAALGLYWLPTPNYPAGRIEIDESCFRNVHLAREVMLAELAHCVDYAVLTSAQREAINARLHDNAGDHTAGPTTHPDDWFEGHDDNYYSWPGERFMSLFMAAVAPKLQRPLEPNQPWTHHYDGADVEAVRRILA